jgi:gamma-glutamyl-gamma-aminobutyrate hydrolase PuuD
VQWHPEFHYQSGTEFLDCGPLLEAFLDAAERAR